MYWLSNFLNYGHIYKQYSYLNKKYSATKIFYSEIYVILTIDITRGESEKGLSIDK